MEICRPAACRPLPAAATAPLCNLLCSPLCLPAGFGRLQWALLAYCGLCWLADACEVMLLSFLGPAVRCAWGIGPGGETALTSVVFLAMLAGVTSLGAISDHLGRRRGFLSSALLLGAAGLASALAPSFGVRRRACCCCLGPAAASCLGAAELHRTALWLLDAQSPLPLPAFPLPGLQWLLVLRGVVGFALGGTPIAVTLLAEFCSSEGRGKWLLLMQSFWTLGGCCRRPRWQARGVLLCPVALLHGQPVNQCIPA